MTSFKPCSSLNQSYNHRLTQTLNPLQKDAYYNANDSRVVALNPQSTTGSYPPYQVFLPIGTGIDDFIFATALQGPVSYNIPVPNGQYAVDLQFAEIEPGVGSGQRVFSVNLQGALAIANLDIFNQSGGNRTALVIQKEVVVTSGTLKIDLVPVVGQPIINGLFIHPGLATATGNLTGKHCHVISCLCCWSLSERAAYSAELCYGNRDPNR